MNLCYLSNSAMPSDNANSLAIVKMCEYLKKIGHEVTLILPNTGYDVSCIKFYNIKNTFKFTRCKNFKNIFSWKLEIDKLKNQPQKNLIISNNNLKLSKKYSLKERAKKFLKN